MFNFFGGRKNFNGLLGTLVVFVWVTFLLVTISTKGEVSEQAIEIMKWGVVTVAGILGVTNVALAQSDQATKGKDDTK